LAKGRAELSSEIQGSTVPGTAHAALRNAYPDEERLRKQAERHDRVFAGNLALLAQALAE